MNIYQVAVHLGNGVKARVPWWSEDIRLVMKNGIFLEQMEPYKLEYYTPTYKELISTEWVLERS